jgi:hypothetical protein
MEKVKIYLDDMRTPVDKNWVVVRDYDEFVSKVTEVGLGNIEVISLDHDLGDTAMGEYFRNVAKNYILDYSNIEEKTGYDCCKWLVNHFYDKNPKRLKMNRIDKKSYPIKFPEVGVHSANPIGSGNMMGYINNFLMNEGQPQTCIRFQIDHTV